MYSSPPLLNFRDSLLSFIPSSQPFLSLLASCPEILPSNPSRLCTLFYGASRVFYDHFPLQIIHLIDFFHLVLTTAASHLPGLNLSPSLPHLPGLYLSPPPLNYLASTCLNVYPTQLVSTCLHLPQSTLLLPASISSLYLPGFNLPLSVLSIYLAFSCLHISPPFTCLPSTHFPKQFVELQLSSD